MIKQTLCGLALCAILIFGGGTAYTQFVHLKVRGIDYLTDQDLQQRYEAYNTEYFEGKLPPAKVHFVKDLKWQGERVMGLTFPGNPYQIYIDDEYSTSPVVAMEIEIHEQCHAVIDESAQGAELDQHGPRWQTCMLRVAEHGGFKGVW